MEEKQYYDGTKILSLKDINGNKPEVYVVEGNRIGGKTTFFYHWRIKKFIKKKEKTLWLYRFQSDIDDCADKIFKELKGIWYQNYDMDFKKFSGGRYANLYLNGEHNGYALPLNSSDAIKNMSHVFTDVDCMLFDEFQPESGKYCAGEIRKFNSVHSSIARGQGKQIRHVPVVLIANTVSLLNPYYVALGLSTRIQSKTKYLRGNGYVFERAIVESAKKAQSESAFNQAFSSDSYNAYAQEGVYLLDKARGIKKLKGRRRYLATIYYGDGGFSVCYGEEDGLLYLCGSCDQSFPLKISLCPRDMENNTRLKSMYKRHIDVWRTFFEMGRMRFEGLLEKECAMDLLSY